MTLLDLIGPIGPVLLALNLLLLVPVFVLFAQLVAAALPGARSVTSSPDPAGASSLAVLMPAHDEAAGIEAAIRAILPQLGARDRLLVVADNCSDATASVAGAAGAEVIERRDDQRRGKGYALDHGVRWLDRAGHAAPDVVVIVDADCIVAPGALRTLASRCLAAGRPTQALYLMRSPAGASLGMRIAEFAWVVKNRARPLGSALFGAPCQLMGTGMAFPWAVIRHAPLASGHIVEDMQLGLELAGAGTAPLFCPEALVSSVFPTDRAAATTQRTRWEHGHLSVIASLGPRMLWRALVRFDAALGAMVLDLLVPPLAALVLAWVGLGLVDVAWALAAGRMLPVGCAALAFALLAIGVACAWARFGAAIVSLRELLALPLYVAAKIPVYVRLFTKRQVEWVRTKRDD